MPKWKRVGSLYVILWGVKVPRRNWEEVEQIYILGDSTLPELAAQTGIPYSTILKQSANRDWSTKRQVYRNSHKTSISQRLRVIDGSIPPKSPPQEGENLRESLGFYRQQLEGEIQSTPARSRESLIDTILKLERVRREWFPPSNTDYLDQVAGQFIKRGITLNEFVDRLNQLSAQ